MSARGERISSPSSSLSSDLTTSREVLENVYHLDGTVESQQKKRASSTSVSSPTSSNVSRSRSTADIPSEVLGNSQEDEHAIDEPNERAQLSANLTHGHLLPTGWACNYYPNTDEYRFEYSLNNEAPQANITGASTQDRTNDVKTPTRDDTVQTSRRPTLHLFECQYGYHFPTSPTSSMISELAKQVQKNVGTSASTQPTVPKTRQVGYGKNKLTLPTDKDEQARRLCDMFPTATGPVIEQMIRIYHGREGLIKAALISLGYKRSTEYNTQQAAAQSPIMLMMSKPASKKLFDKLVAYFPDKDESLIKSLMYKHKEIEHEVISALVESFEENSMSHHAESQAECALKLDRSGAIMKLRYLKFLYPTCEEIEIYHLLNCNDLNAQKVMEIVESRGHKQANIEEVLQNRKSQTQQMRAQQTAHAAKEKACSSATDLVQAHTGRPRPTVTESRINNLKTNLKNTFDNIDDGLAQGALEAADYNESLAKRFLEERRPIDESIYKQRYQTEIEKKMDTICFPCKAIQKDDTNFISIMSNENVYIPREIVECDNALALLKIDASTFTGDDIVEIKSKLAKGRQFGLNRGPSIQRQHEIKLRESCRIGCKSDLRRGTKHIEFSSDPKRTRPGTIAIGQNKSLAKGRDVSLRCGHNAKLTERIHPFYCVSVPKALVSSRNS